MERMAAIDAATGEHVSVGRVGLKSPEGNPLLGLFSSQKSRAWLDYEANFIPNLHDPLTRAAIVERIRAHMLCPTVFILPPHSWDAPRDTVAGRWAMLAHAGVSPILSAEPVGVGEDEASAVADALRRMS